MLLLTDHITRPCVVVLFSIPFLIHNLGRNNEFSSVSSEWSLHKKKTSILSDKSMGSLNYLNIPENKI